MDVLEYLILELIKDEPDDEFVQPLNEEIRISLAESYIKIIKSLNTIDKVNNNLQNEKGEISFREKVNDFSQNNQTNL